MNIKRTIEQDILNHFDTSNKGILVYGPRQVGKTTLINGIVAKKNWKILVLNGDRRGDWLDILISRELPKLKLMLAGYDALFIDEAQRIPEIGLSLKIILDEFPGLKVLITGSSSIDLSSKVSEPLTGRIYTYKLYPISQQEMRATMTPLELRENIEERLLFGSYPEVFSLDGMHAKIEYLVNLTDNYLYKDLLDFDGIRNSRKIRDLLKLLAFQAGSQVSISELAKTLELARTTVDKYIDLLEKSYVIFRLGGFSRNLRKEVTKMDKIYFYDLGVRNAVIGNFNFMTDRNDVGALWENFLIIERMKLLTYAHTHFSHYFWRLTSGSEIDLVEEESGHLTGYEFKFGTKIAKPPLSWLSSYKNATFQTINKENYLDFIL